MKKIVTMFMALALFAFSAAPAFAATTIIVAPSNTQGWYSADTRTGGQINFIDDVTSPFPSGALQMITNDTTAAKAQYLKDVNTPLSDVTNLKYYTKYISGPSHAAQSFQVVVDLNGVADGGWTTLVYEPYWNGTVDNSGTWQSWDINTTDAKLWSSRSFTEGDCSVISGAGGPPFYSLDSIKTSCPNTVVLSIGLNVGSYNANYNVEADGLVFNDTTYNFESFVRSAEITAPTSGQTVSGSVNFSAVLHDDDKDDIQWAVRKGTCAAGTGTVFGNVDGKSDSATIDQSDLSNQTFSFTGDMSSMVPGMYCFIYNPVDDGDETDFRLTREFTLLDTIAPIVTIESPLNGGVVSGTVKIFGTVTDDYILSHYNIAIYKGADSFMDFSKRIDQKTVDLTDSFTNQEIFVWDTTNVLYPDGEYQIRLAARDAAGNRDLVGAEPLGGDNSQHVIRVIVNNTPDNKDQCKNYGWRTFYTPSFMSQGDCVSWIQAKGKAWGLDNH